MTSPLPPRRRDTTTLADLLRQDRTNLRQLDPGLMNGRFTPTKPPEPFLEDDEEGDDEDGDLDLPQWLNTDHATAAANDQPVTLTLTYEPDEPSLQVKQNGVDLLPSEWSLNGSVVTIVPSAGVPIRAGDTFHAVYRYFSPLTPLVLDFADTVTDLAPLIWYRLNEASGTVAADSGSLGRDGSANTIAWGAAGLLTNSSDTAAGFGGVNAQISRSYETWNFPSGVSAVVLFTAVDPGDPIAFFPFGASQLFNVWPLWAIALTDGDLTIKVDSTLAVAAASLADGARHMGGFTYDGTTIRLYLDGALVGTQAAPGMTYAGSGSLTLGSGPYGGGGSYPDHFAGVEDEAMIFDKVLTDDDMSNLWAAS